MTGSRDTLIEAYISEFARLRRRGAGSFVNEDDLHDAVVNLLKSKKSDGLIEALGGVGALRLVGKRRAQDRRAADKRQRALLAAIGISLGPTPGEQ